jgi:hypothetical protein
MIMQIRAKLLLMLFSVVVTASAQQVQWLSCGPVAVEGATLSPLQLDSVALKSADNFSYGDMRVVNHGASAILRFLIIVELLDRQNDHIITVPFYNRSYHQGKLHALEFKYQDWLQAYASTFDRGIIEPSQELTASFAGPLLPNQCPTKARVLSAELELDNGAIVKHGKFPLTLDTLVMSISAVATRNADERPPRIFVTRVRVEANGTFSYADQDQLDGAPADLAQILKHCHFFPGVTSGDLTASMVTLAFAFTVDDKADWKMLKDLRKADPVMQAIQVHLARGLGGNSWVFGLSTGGAIDHPVLNQ